MRPLKAQFVTSCWYCRAVQQITDIVKKAGGTGSVEGMTVDLSSLKCASCLLLLLPSPTPPPTTPLHILHPRLYHEHATYSNACHLTSFIQVLLHSCRYVVLQLKNVQHIKVVRFGGCDARLITNYRMTLARSCGAAGPYTTLRRSSILGGILCTCSCATLVIAPPASLIIYLIIYLSAIDLGIPCGPSMHFCFWGS